MDSVPKSEDNENSVMDKTDMQIKHEEEVAMELQIQLLEENDVAATGAELTDMSTEIAVEDNQSNGMNENMTETNSTKGFTSPTSVVQELEKRVDKNSQFLKHYEETNTISQNS